MITDIQELKNQPALVELLLILLAYKHTHTSTLDLLRLGILGPAAGIARLKDLGVCFDTVYQSLVDGSGKTRKRIACYKIVGGVAI